jgi:hypothetical protein
MLVGAHHEHRGAVPFGEICSGAAEHAQIENMQRRSTG